MNKPLIQPVSRRDMLRSAGAGFGYLALAGMCGQAFGAAAPSSSGRPEPMPGYRSPLSPKMPHFLPKAKRVIFLFMQGGPSHVDTFDYKPHLQQDGGQAGGAKGKGRGGKLLASSFKFSQHGQSGLWISDLFPHLSQHADDLCLLNSMHTDNPAHPQATIQLHTGSITFVRPSVGAWVLYGLGTENQDLPGFITISPPTGLGGAQNYGSAFLPATFQGTRIDGGGIADIANGSMTSSAQRRQIDLVQQMNKDFGGRVGPNEQLEGLIESFELGFRMQHAVPDVMDISKESKETLDLYGIESTGRGSAFGRQCLMARRFAEAGVRFIEVCQQGWDHHNNLHQRITNSARQTDQAIAGLLTDLKRRGLLKDTLVVWGGEFGRSPNSQNGDGRNHNNHGYTMWLAGGGVKGGMRYGATDEYGAAAVQDPMHVHDLHATLLNLLGLNHERLTYRYAGRDFRLTDVYGNVVKDIMA